MKWKDSYHPYAMTTIAFWSLAFVFTRLALQYFSPFSLGFLRYFTASLTLAAVAFFTKMQLPKKRDLPLFLISGALGFFLYMIVFNLGSQAVTAATGSVIMASVPVMTALLARVIYKERLCGIQWLAIPIEFAGILVLVLRHDGLTVNTGTLWLLLAAAALSSYNLLQRRLTKTYSALQASTFSIFAGTLMLCIFAPPAIRELRQAPAIQFFYIAVLGIFSSAIAYVAWSKAFSKADTATQVSNYMFITPLLTSLLGFLLANESPDAPTIIGGAVILSGVLLFHYGGKRHQQIRHQTS